MICNQCHEKQYGTTIKAAHCNQEWARCNVCRKMEYCSDCHCYLRNLNQLPHRHLPGKLVAKQFFKSKQ